MDKESLRSNNNVNNHPKDKSALAPPDASSLLLRGSSDTIRQAATATTSDLLLRWGNRKRLRCMKIQVKDDSSATVQRTTVRVDRRVVKDPPNHSTPPIPNSATTTTAAHNHSNNRYPNLRQRSSSPQQPPPRILRNSEGSGAMRGQSNGGVRGIASPDTGAHDKRGSHHHHHHDNNRSAASSDTAHDSKKGGSPSGSGDAAPPVWPPKFVIALTNKEKEEDFLAIKGSKLPQRPKKRAKFIQRTLNVVLVESTTARSTRQLSCSNWRTVAFSIYDRGLGSICAQIILALVNSIAPNSDLRFFDPSLNEKTRGTMEKTN